MSDDKEIEFEEVELCEGKYTVCLKGNGMSFYALRYHGHWRDLTGDGLALAMFQEIRRLQELVKLARDTYLEENSDGETDCITPYDH